jgi:hypothetical protein
MRLDILFFIGYDIDEELPWHSTISRTRQLFPEAVFEEVFTRVLTMCVEKGMVSGHTQAIDSAPVKANASMDTLELKVPEEELESHLRKVRHISAMDRGRPHRKSKGTGPKRASGALPPTSRNSVPSHHATRSGRGTRTNVRVRATREASTPVTRRITVPPIQMPVSA